MMKNTLEQCFRKIKTTIDNLNYDKLATFFNVINTDHENELDFSVINVDVFELIVYNNNGSCYVNSHVTINIEDNISSSYEFEKEIDPKMLACDDLFRFEFDDTPYKFISRTYYKTQLIITCMDMKTNQIHAYFCHSKLFEL